MQAYAPIRPDRPINVTPIPIAVETQEVVKTGWTQIEEWPEVVGPEIFDEIQNWWTTYTFMTEETALLLTLWSAHANMWQGFQNTPRLVIDSPTKGCGKTLVLFVLGELINKAKHSGAMSEAAFVRYASKGELVVLYDEADQAFRGNSDLTKVLNNGWHQHGTFDTCTPSGDGTWEPTPLPVHSCVALAGINIPKHLQEATLDRSIIIQMMKARPGDLPERFNERKHKTELKVLGRKLLRWCNDHKQHITPHESCIPDDVDNREFWKWNPLVAIAEFIGEDYTKRALRLMRNKVEVDEEDQGTKFLRDCFRVYNKRILELPNYGVEPYQGMHKVGIRPNALAYELCQLTDEDDPNYRHWERFHTHKGRVDEDAKLRGMDCTKFLKSRYHKVKSSMRWGNGDGENFKAYSWVDILDAQKRYAPLKDQDAYEPGLDMEPSL